MPTLSTLRTYFFAAVARDSASDCIVWTRGVNEKGYGKLMLDGRSVRAHRVSWLLKHGSWPPAGLCVLHRCDNPPCVNPDHLFLGTHKDNVHDAMRKGRRHQQDTKLEGLEISEALALSDTGMTFEAIGALYGVSKHHIRKLRQKYRRGGAAKVRAAVRVEVAGTGMTIAELAARAGVDAMTIRYRLKRGLSGSALLAGKHKAPRKQYVRRK